MNSEERANKMIAWIRDELNRGNVERSAVIGISGGKDSSIAAALCVAAVGVDRVIAVKMPYDKQADIEYADNLANLLGLEPIEINIAPAIDYLDKASGVNNTHGSISSAKARMRMVSLYLIAQSCGGRVINTSNLSEIFIGYSTRYGDMAGDIYPFKNLTASEVKQIGYAIGLPKEFIEKPPSDGLSGKTDEENFGFSYTQLDDYLRRGSSGDVMIDEKIISMHLASDWKRKPMPSYFENRNLC